MVLPILEFFILEARVWRVAKKLRKKDVEQVCTLWILSLLMAMLKCHRGIIVIILGSLKPCQSRASSEARAYTYCALELPVIISPFWHCLRVFELAAQFSKWASPKNPPKRDEKQKWIEKSRNQGYVTNFSNLQGEVLWRMCFDKEGISWLLDDPSEDWKLALRRSS